MAQRIFSNPGLDLAWALEVPWRRAEIPAANGFGNARALARLMSVLACQGEIGGRRLMSAAGALEAISPAWHGMDMDQGGEIGFGSGFALNLGPLKFGAGRCGYWGGAGGSLVVVDFDRRLSFAYVMNRLGGAPFGDPRNMNLIGAVYAALGQ
jgi:CubicO group peptidase (beta-lactamase class C family)